MAWNYWFLAYTQRKNLTWIVIIFYYIKLNLAHSILIFSLSLKIKTNFRTECFTGIFRSSNLSDESGENVKVGCVVTKIGKVTDSVWLHSFWYLDESFPLLIKLQNLLTTVSRHWPQRLPIMTKFPRAQISYKLRIQKEIRVDMIGRCCS